MAKNPAFLFYPSDWQAGTMTLNRIQKGCYIDLICAQFSAGPLSISEVETVLGKDFNSWPALQKKFKQNEAGFFYNERLEIEKDKRAAYVESRHNNKTGKNQYSKKRKKRGHTPGHMSGHMTEHMGNRNRNENINENANENDLIADENFSKFQAWLNENAPRVNQLKEPFTRDQYFKLKNNFSTETVITVLTAMQNKADLLRKYISAYQTALNWCKRETLNSSNNGKQNFNKSKSATANKLYAEVAEFVNKGF